MGFLDSVKRNKMGTKAYRTHVAGMQLRSNGKYMEAEEKLNEAIQLYEEAYQMGYRGVNAMQGYALLLMRRGNFERARELMLECNKSKDMTPNERHTLRIDYSICEWKMGKLDKAIETIRRAASTQMNGSIYTTLGMFLVEQARQTGDTEEALAFNLEAYEYDDEDAGTLDNMGQLHLLMSAQAKARGDEEEAAELHKKAVEYLKKAYSVKPEQISSAYYYAKVLHEDGDDEKARSIMKELMKIPFSAMIQVSKEQAEALQKEIG